MIHTSEHSVVDFVGHNLGPIAVLALIAGGFFLAHVAKKGNKALTLLGNTPDATFDGRSVK